ncbi:hypothetical protein K0M31_008211 [Melipona bicolor]|uniref:Uncharacterized protein n=1 Tax=Melipona bicolor TaxID=60889 RepID=A0AA40KKL2_9HYME|nr:hypothetical protein K0M31_008211 [Melipona bicolor]
MELRSMSRRLPLYMHDKQRFVNSQNVSTTKKQNGPLQTHFYFYDIPFAISFSSSALIFKALKINPSLKIKGQSKIRVKEEDNSPPVIIKDLKEPKPNENTIIKATHFALNMKTMETIKIDFEEINKTCVATGESVSNEWFRIFDYGINYCNLHNLVTEIGFDKSSKFLELTTNAVCTQYNMAVCN